MGLDMYLEAKLHLPPYNSELASVRQAIGQAIGYTPPTEKPDNDATLMEITGVTVRVGYWRKFDPLHQWFVNNVQEGHDDCRPASMYWPTWKSSSIRSMTIRRAPASISSATTSR